MRLKIVSLLLSFILLCSFTIGNSHDGLSILKEMFNKSRSVRSLRLTMFMKERVGKKYVLKKSDFKVVYKPHKIYLRQEYPNKGLEVLYVEGEHENKAIVSPKSFPWAILKLDPTGNMMRKGQHHSIFKSGFDFFINTLENICDKYNKDIDNMLKYEGTVKYAGVECYKIDVDNNHFTYKPYQVKDGENLESISGKLNICDYMVLEKNPDIRTYDYIKPGTKLLVPSDYAKKFTIYIDKDKMIPVGVSVFDEVGLFEEYTFVDVTLNPSFSLTDFDSNNPEYSFH
jgi:outer membrane lipoprotein-sorting protein